MRKIFTFMNKKLPRKDGDLKKLVTFVTDRAGHDLRYVVDSAKLRMELNWVPNLRIQSYYETQYHGR